MADNQQTFLLDVNPHFVGKVRPGDRRFWRFNMSFESRRVTLDELAASIRAGHAWTAPHAKERRPRPGGGLSSYRVKANVTGAQLLALDCDTGDQRATFASWLADPFVASYAAFLHTTASHTPDAPRCRVVFALDQLLDPAGAELATRALLWRFPHCDQVAKDVSRVFYGAAGCDVHMVGQVLPVAVLWRDLVDPYQAHLTVQEAQRQAERDRLLAERTARAGDQVAHGDQVARYVAALLDRTLAGVAAAQAGTGQRHQLLRDAALRLASVAAADWLTDDAAGLLADLDGQLLAAAAASGYLADYGEDAARRTIASGLALATPADRPVLAVHFGAGDQVVVTRPGVGQVAAGRVDRMRQAGGFGHWEALVGGVWWPRDWLAHAAGVAGAASVQSERPQVARAVPPVPEDPPDWWDTVAAEAGQRGAFAVDVEPDQRGVVTLPAGQYLADLDLALPARCILNADTGTGKTTWAATRPGQVVVVMSSVIAVQQQAARYPDAGVWYEREKRLGRVTFVTYEGFPACARALLDAGVDPAGVAVFVDEQHNLALAGYRHKALRRLVTTLELHPWAQVVFMSGTPLDVFHPYLASFERVTVVSQRRQQRAVMVHWRAETEDGDHTGRRVDTVARLVTRHTAGGGRVVVHLNDKGTGLDRLVAALRAAGVAERSIYKLNADTKYESIGRHVIEYETLPADCLVLVVTDVLIESANLRTDLAAVVFCDPVHPAHAQQLVNRQRGPAGPGVAYVLTTGTGRGYGLDLEDQMAWVAARAQDMVDAKNALTERAHSDQLRAIFGGDHGHLVRWDKLAGAWAVDHLGVGQYVHQGLVEHCAHNPAAFKAMTGRWAWTWLADEDLVLTGADKTPAQADMEKALANEYAALARADWLDRVAHVATLTAAQAEAEMAAFDPPPPVKRVLERALDLDRQLAAGAEDDDADTWARACALLAAGRDSTQAYHRALDLVAADQLRRAGDAFVADLVAAFELGRPYTQAERHAVLVSVYERHPHMRPFVTPVRRFSWSAAATAKMDGRQADRVLRLLFTIRTSQQRLEDGVVRVWTLTGLDPLAAELAHGRQVLLEDAVAAGVGDPAGQGGTAGAQSERSSAPAVTPNSSISKGFSEFGVTENGQKSGGAGVRFEPPAATTIPAGGDRWAAMTLDERLALAFGR